MPRRPSIMKLDPERDPFLPGMDFAAHTQLDAMARAGARVAFVDIETTGLGVSDVITVAAWLAGDSLRVFTRGENLDDLLPALEEVDVVATFNGRSFDIPRILDHFHIPSLRPHHVDLRLAFREAGWTGGLKEIERRLGIGRPPDLKGVDGEEALYLWGAWDSGRDASARVRLLRYCAADVVALQRLASRLLRQSGFDGFPEAGWDLLDAVGPGPCDDRAPAVAAARGGPTGLDARLRKFRAERLQRVSGEA